ncbi:MAG: DUF2007 domain-containing protein [Thiothrix sp.]|nr:DUF2007 domain-containing protein [Thiothrix sp.]HPE62353.1 DUF2007 domain-containing protein [Thiolinea sp.]
MKIIYRAANVTEAHIVAGMLDAHGIESHVGGHFLQGGVGELAPMDFATVLVADEDYTSALSVIADYERTEPPTRGNGEKNNDSRLPRYSGLFSEKALFLGVILLLVYWFLF